MYNPKLLHIENSRSLNDQLSIDGLNDHCDYIDPSMIKELHTKSTDLCVMQLNVRGLLNKQTQIKNLLGKNNVSLPIDVILLCETWLRPSTLDLIDIPNYKSFHVNRKDRIGGGISVLVNENLRSRKRNDLLVETMYLEHCIVELKTDKRNILLVSAYRPPNTSPKMFLTEYKRLLDKLKKQKDHEIILGLDHNLDLLKSHLNQPTSEFIELNLDKELIPSITKPTRMTTKSASLIDNIMISRSLQRNYDSFVIIEDISDHFACLLVLKGQNKSTKGPKYIKTRNLDDKKVTDIVTSILQKDWKEILNPLDVNEGFNMFHSFLVTTIDKIAPEKETRLNKGITPRDPWISKEILHNIQKQKKLYAEQLNDTTKLTQYRVHRNKTKRDIRVAKINYFREKCREYKQDSRKLWKLIHTILNKSTNKGDSITAIKKEGIPRYDPSTITEELCKHFSSIGETFANRILPSRNDIGSYLNNIPQNECSIFLDPTNATEISNLITNLVPKNSGGYDNLSNKLIKKIVPAIVNPLTIIFNKSLMEGVFPDAMKKADVVPLYKAKDHQESNNYRPISLLLTLSKLLEKIMHKRIYQFLESSEQIYKSQYGFRTAHSCENAISELVSEIIKGKQDGMYTLAVFLDLSKAFDSLEHTVLLNKMYKYGIRGVAYDWFESYLTGRQMRVKCKVTSTGRTEYSEYMDVTYGTPQGSCLGPLIFLIFTNDLYRHLVYSSAILFADDTTLYKTHRNLVYLKWCLEDDLHTLSDWFAANKLTLNLDKTVCILFQKNNNHMEIELKVNNMIISSRTETKFLGMWLDQSLSWHSHIQKLILKIKRNKYLLNNGKHLMDKKEH